ncbi:MAG: outer membrane beta-barrel protein [Flavobacteriales bacterium]|nr:outer membrane beta-barrel protein [Flavobacteriales bacterium]
MTKNILTSILLVLLFSSAFSQNISSYKVQGTVVDEADSPIEMGNVIALSKNDSSLIKGNFFMDGKFEIDNIIAEEFLLKITSLGYSNIIISIENKTGLKVINVPTIKIKSDALLEEVQIRADIPMFETKAGKIVVNVANTLFAESMDVEEILKKSPRVDVQDGAVNIIGIGGAVIYVDNKRVSFDIAQQIPVAEIKTIELITSHSAKYDASATAVVNIITKNFHLIGSQLTLRNDLIYATFKDQLFDHPNFLYHFRKEKYSLMLRYRDNLGNNHRANEFSIVSDQGYSNNYIQNYNNKRKYKSEFTLGSEFYFKNDQSLSVELYSSIYKANLHQHTQTTKGAPGLMDEILYTNMDETNNTKWGQLSINYTNDLDTLGGFLFAGADFGLSSKISNYDVVDWNEFGANEVSSALERDYEYMNLQLDYAKYFNEDRVIETGAKASFASSINLTAISSNDTRSELKNGTADVMFNENITAVYFQFSDKIKKSYYTIGTRAEYAQWANYTDGGETETFDTALFHLIPSATFSFREKVDFSYSTRVNRPNYSSLGGGRTYLGADYFTKGNGKLIPSFMHSFEISAFDGLVSLRHNYVNNPSWTATLASNDSLNYFYDVRYNFKSIRDYMISSFKKWTFKKWNTSHWVAIYHADVRDFNFEPAYTMIPGYMHWTRTEATLNQQLRADVTMTFRTQRSTGFRSFERYFQLGCGLYYTSKSKRLKTNVALINITNQQTMMSQSLGGTGTDKAYM